MAANPEKAIKTIESLISRIGVISKKEYNEKTTVKEFAEIVIDVTRFVRLTIKGLKERDWYPEYYDFTLWRRNGVRMHSEFWDYSKKITIGIAYEKQISNLKLILNDCKKDFEMMKQIRSERHDLKSVTKKEVFHYPKNIIPIIGNWDIGQWEKDKSKITYVSPLVKNLDGRDPRNAALALFEGQISRGIIETDVQFSEIGSKIARIIIGYNPETHGYYSVGIGGYDIAYLIDRYDRNIGWKALYYKGKRADIKRQKIYHLSVLLDKKNLILKVDNEELFSCTLAAEDLGTQIGLFSWGAGNVEFSNIKFSDIKHNVSSPKETIIPKYDIAVSFAGEDRETVEDYVKLLESNNISVFYDKNEQVDLWGKDLYEKLDQVYRTQAKYCVIFISQSYRDKLWTNHERKSAQARAFKENKEYILPVKLDDTEIPGIRETIGYIDLRNNSIEDLAEITIKKLNT